MTKVVTYSRLQSLLHWSTAAMVVFQILVHSDIGHAYHLYRDGDVPSSAAMLWANIDVYLGILVLFLGF